MLAVFVVWQVGAVLHLVLDTHCVLPDGRIADIDPETGEPIPEGNGPGSSNGCPVLDKLTSATTMVEPGASSVLLLDVALPTPQQEPAAPTVCSRELFRLSPSNSPPAPC
jgi:hypothetical protein